MSDSLIIIPSRLKAKRLPNKPILKINGIPMIIHVIKRAKESLVGDVIVATPDKQIEEVVKNFSERCIMTSDNHSTGTDRIYEALNKINDKSKYKLIINLQGDMPNINPQNIKDLDYLMKKKNSEIGTLASQI